MMEAGLWLLVFDIVLFGVLAALWFSCPSRVVTETVTKVEHDYKLSTDYERLYDLLDEGRGIIVLDENGYPRKVTKGKNLNGEVYYWGLDIPRGCTREKFLRYCEFAELRYFDQIEKYLTLKDYMKK